MEKSTNYSIMEATELLFTEILAQYVQDNPKVGYLRFQITTAQGMLPVHNAVVTVSKSLGEDYFVSKVLYSDESGQTAVLALPTPSAQFPQGGLPYSLYDVKVTESGHKTIEVYSIPVFEGITSIQPIHMNLAVSLEDRLVTETTNEFAPYDL